MARCAALAAGLGRDGGKGSDIAAIERARGGNAGAVAILSAGFVAVSCQAWSCVGQFVVVLTGFIAVLTGFVVVLTGFVAGLVKAGAG